MGADEVDETEGWLFALLVFGVVLVLGGAPDWVEVILLVAEEAVPLVVMVVVGAAAGAAADGGERLEVELALLEVARDWLLDLRVEPTSLRKREFIWPTCSVSAQVAAATDRSQLTSAYVMQTKAHAGRAGKAQAVRSSSSSSSRVSATMAETRAGQRV